jgi:hypothetical protein
VKAAEWPIRALTWSLLAGWFGSWTLFSLVIAPTAFQVLPSLETAGTLIAPVLGTLHRYGIFAGISLALLSALVRRGWLATTVPVLLAAICAVSEYLVTPGIAEVRSRSFGADQEQTAAQRFSDLHQVSRYLFGAVLLGVLGLIVLHTRPDSPGRGHPIPQSRT